MCSVATSMSPLVRVFVLPVTTSLTEPAASRPAFFLTWRHAAFRFYVEKAIARDIASGMPSGTLTMSSATAIVRFVRSACKDATELR